jgi:hypothetical protein
MLTHDLNQPMKSNMRHYNLRHYVAAWLACSLVSFHFAPLCFGESPVPAKLDLFPNYNTIGVNVALAVGDAQKDAWASLEYGLAKANCVAASLCRAWTTSFSDCRVVSSFADWARRIMYV